MEDKEVIFHEGKARNRQRRQFEELQTRTIFATRYIDENCLYSLSIYHSVFYMLDNLGLHDIF